MKYSLDKYKYYTKGNTVYAVSTYAGRTVKGKAMCDPRDNYDVEAGKKLAAARCNAKVAVKRTARAASKVKIAKAELAAAQEYLNRMEQYYADSVTEQNEAVADLNALYQSM